MRKLLVLLGVLFLVGSVFAVDEREGFVKQLRTTSDVLTVPQGKRLVILQMLTRNPYRSWKLEIDGNSFLDQDVFGFISDIDGYSTGVVANFDITFPDRCITAEQGQTLSFEGGASVTIIGYLYNFYCDSYPLSDLNKDCKVDLIDMAIMASEWLMDGMA